MTKISLSLMSIDRCGDVRLSGAGPRLRQMTDGRSWRTGPPFLFCPVPLASPPRLLVVLEGRGAASVQPPVSRPQPQDLGRPGSPNTLASPPQHVSELNFKMAVFVTASSNFQ